MAIDGTFLMLACCFSLCTIQNFRKSLLIWNYSHTSLVCARVFSDLLLVLSVIREDIFVCVILVYYLERYE